MLSMPIMVRDTGKVQSDAFPTGKYGNEDRDYISIDFYDYDQSSDIVSHLRMSVPYEQAVDLHQKMGVALAEISEARVERAWHGPITVRAAQSWDHAGGVAGTGDGQ
jgi:hypothetical protein